MSYGDIIPLGDDPWTAQLTPQERQQLMERSGRQDQVPMVQPISPLDIAQVGADLAINGSAPAPGTPAAVDRSTQMVRQSLNARLGASTAPAYTGSVLGQTLTPATMAPAPAPAPAGPLVPTPKPPSAAPAAASKYGFIGAEIPSFNPVSYLNSHAARAEAAAAAGTGAEAAQAARAAGRLRFAGNALKWGGRLGTAGAVALGPAMSAVSGTQEAGIGGGAIQGGAALAGSLIGFGLGGPLGAMAGGFVGDMVGKGASGLAVSAVDKAQQGDAGPMGAIGRALDPFIDTAFEKEQAAVLQQMNSPAMQQIRDQERTRELKARNDQQQDLLLQMTAQGAFA